MQDTYKVIKILHIARGTRKTLKRGKNEKRKVQKTFNNDSKILYFYFLYMEKDTFYSKT